jgi:hypothetical protein
MTSKVFLALADSLRSFGVSDLKVKVCEDLGVL